MLTGCSTPSLAERINWDVNRSHPYSHYIRKVKDAHYLQPGEPGNCTDIVYTKKVELEKVGLKATMFACNLQDGQGHAFLMTSEGALNNRTDALRTYQQVGCTE